MTLQDINLGAASDSPNGNWLYDTTAGTKTNAVIDVLKPVTNQTPQEAAASITPTNPGFPFLDARRYGIDAALPDNTANMQLATRWAFASNIRPAHLATPASRARAFRWRAPGTTTRSGSPRI